MLINDIKEYIKLIYFLLKPNTIFVQKFSNGIGDNLLLSVLLPHLRKKNQNSKIIVESSRPELFFYNPYIDWVTVKHIKTTKKFIKPKYVVYPSTKNSFIKQILNYIKVNGNTYPKIYLTEEEIRKCKIKYPQKYITISPTGKTEFSGNRKEWGIDNFQKIRDIFSEIDFVQVGTNKDELLNNVIDARDMSLRKTAAILYNSMFFLGLEGGFMHLNKAVGKNSIIIFGGYIHPEISGYKNDENIYIKEECSPCYNSERKHTICRSMKCMKKITPDMIKKKITDILSEINN